jgi:hypothetical protein
VARTVIVRRALESKLKGKETCGMTQNKIVQLDTEDIRKRSHGCPEIEKERLWEERRDCGLCSLVSTKRKHL